MLVAGATAVIQQVQKGRAQGSPWLLALLESLGLSLDRIERLVRVISPLALAPRIAWDRRYLYAATADRLVPPHGVQALWEHWGRPRLDWYDGSHVSFGWEPTVQLRAPR